VARGVDHDQQLHQHLVGLRADRLHHVDVLAAHVVDYLDVGLTVRETTDVDVAQPAAEVGHHPLSQRQVRGS
jgi:hypothetical protein